jgi:hypothetical protein
MEPQVTIIPERLSGHTHDTSRSWRLLKRFFPLGLGLLVGGIIFYNSFFDHYGTDPDSKISAFEASLKNYIRSAASQNLILSPPSSYGFNLDAPSGLRGELQLLMDSANSLKYDGNRELAKVKAKFAIDEYNAERGMRRLEYTSQELDILEQPDGWKRTNYLTLLFESLKISIISFVCTFVIAYILVIIFAFSWWFFMDRLKDISKAIRGN